MTENATTEWTPKPCDPDAESVKPEGLADTTWDMLNEVEKHAISQHVHPDQRIKTAEVQAYVAAMGAMGISQNEALSEVLLALLDEADEEFVLTLLAEKVTEATARVSQQVINIDPAALFEAIFGQPMPEGEIEETEG